MKTMKKESDFSLNFGGNVITNNLTAVFDEIMHEEQL